MECNHHRVSVKQWKPFYQQPIEVSQQHQEEEQAVSGVSNLNHDLLFNQTSDIPSSDVVMTDDANNETLGTMNGCIDFMFKCSARYVLACDHKPKHILQKTWT